MTQASLVNAAKESTYSSASAAKKTGGTAAAKKESAAAAKKTAAGKNALELTAAEKKLVELYRAADAETKKKALAVLKGEQTDAADLLSSLLGNAFDNILGKK